MIQDVGNAVRRFVEVDWDVGGAQPQDCEIRDMPFGPVRRKQTDVISRFNAELFQRIGEPRDPPQEFGGRQWFPAILHPEQYGSIAGEPADGSEKFFCKCRVNHDEGEHYRTILFSSNETSLRRVLERTEVGLYVTARSSVWRAATKCHTIHMASKP